MENRRKRSLPREGNFEERFNLSLPLSPLAVGTRCVPFTGTSSLTAAIGGTRDVIDSEASGDTAFGVGARTGSRRMAAERLVGTRGLPYSLELSHTAEQPYKTTSRLS